MVNKLHSVILRYKASLSGVHNNSGLLSGSRNQIWTSTAIETTPTFIFRNSCNFKEQYYNEHNNALV